MSTITDWLQRIKLNRETAKQNKIIKQLTENSFTTVQIREFNGKVYLSYKNIPLVEETLFSKPLKEVLKQVRESFVQYSSSCQSDSTGVK